MVRMGIGMMVVIVPVGMVVGVVMIITVRMVMMVMMPVRLQWARGSVAVHGRERKPVLRAKFRIAAGGVAIAVARAVFQSATDAFDVVVMTFLRQADLVLEAKNLFAILAHLAVHKVLASNDLVDPVLEGREDERMIVEVTGLHELDLRMPRCHLVGE